MVSKVIIRKAEYTGSDLKKTVYEILDEILVGFSLKGKKVLVKPNLLAAFSPERAVTTHPLVIKTVSEYLIDNGSIVTISDSPGIGSFHKILSESGIQAALGSIAVKFEEFTNSRSVSINKPFNSIELASAALDADLIINLPKLKTHTQMMLTLGVKNLFGCVVGMQKPQWHFRAGVNRDMFAHLLIEIYRTLKPSVTLLDGILAMEGQGPGKRGTPRHIGVLLGSEDALAIDQVIAQMLHIDQQAIPVNRVAAGLGMLHDVTIDGELINVTEFTFPVLTDLIFGPPSLHRFMRKYLTQRPVEEKNLCKMCLECIAHCPVNAIRENHKALRFDYGMCIRCYCCIELCPHGAMKSTQPLAGRLFISLTKKRKE